jgi:hypothetical protein
VRNNVFFLGIAVIQCEYSDIAGEMLRILAQKCRQKCAKIWVSIKTYRRNSGKRVYLHNKKLVLKLDAPAIMLQSQLYIETATGRKIAVMDMDADGCVVIIQTTGGKEIVRMSGKELSKPRVIAAFYASMMEEYGAFLSACQVSQITAEALGVHPGHVRKCVKQLHESIKRQKQNKARRRFRGIATYAKA